MDQLEVLAIVRNHDLPGRSGKCKLRSVVELQAPRIADSEHIETALLQAGGNVDGDVLVELEPHVQRLEVDVGALNHRQELD